MKFKAGDRVQVKAYVGYDPKSPFKPGDMGEVVNSLDMFGGKVLDVMLDSGEKFAFHYECLEHCSTPKASIDLWAGWEPPPVEPYPGAWKAEGRCPQCGELGPFDPRTLDPVCSKHGPY